MELVNFDSSAFVADEALIEALRARAVPLHCCQDQVLFRQGEEAHGLFLLLSGEATLRLNSPMGDEVVKMPALPGSLLGLPALISNIAYSLSADARRGAEILYLSREEFSKLMMNEPPLAMMMLRVLAAEVRTARIAMATA